MSLPEKRVSKDAFTKIAIFEAANDRMLRGSLEWLILGDTYEVSQGFLENIDHEDILEDISQRYGISPQDALQAQEMCEQGIIERLHNGEA